MIIIILYRPQPTIEKFLFVQVVDTTLGVNFACDVVEVLPRSALGRNDECDSVGDVARIVGRAERFCRRGRGVVRRGFGRSSTSLLVVTARRAEGQNVADINPGF